MKKHRYAVLHANPSEMDAFLQRLEDEGFEVLGAQVSVMPVPAAGGMSLQPVGMVSARIGRDEPKTALEQEWEAQAARAKSGLVMPANTTPFPGSGRAN